MGVLFSGHARNRSRPNPPTASISKASAVAASSRNLNRHRELDVCYIELDDVRTYNVHTIPARCPRVEKPETGAVHITNEITVNFQQAV